MESIEAETRQVMNNIQAILKEAGICFSNVVKSSIFLKDMHQYSKVNEVYASCFSAPYPARETIEVSDLPMHVNIEISVIAVKE
jgi:2-iminobutanoate/2-iminopropanoate deaminase